MDNERKGNGQAQPHEEPRERVFFDLVRMTKDFSLWDEHFVEDSDDETITDDAREMTPQEASQVRQRRRMNDLQAWQCRFLAVIAQQLLVTNIHLKKLVEREEIRKNPVPVGPVRKKNTGSRVD